MSQHNPYYQRFPRDEFADTIELTCEEYGLLQRLRDYSWHKEGVPDSEDFFKRFAKFSQLSRYKFAKLWKKIENFFTLREGFWWYEPDERRRMQVVDIGSKRSQAGKLGAERRWSERNQALADRQNLPMAIAISDPMANDGIPPPHPKPDREEEREPPPPPAPEQFGGGGGLPLFPNQGFEPRTDQQVFSERAEALGLSGVGKALAKTIRAKFPRGWTAQQIADSLVLFPLQKSPGLWGERELDQLLNEARRQNEERRPPMSAEQAASDQRALEIARRSEKQA